MPTAPVSTHDSCCCLFCASGAKVLVFRRMHACMYTICMYVQKHSFFHVRLYMHVCSNTFVFHVTSPGDKSPFRAQKTNRFSDVDHAPRRSSLGVFSREAQAELFTSCYSCRQAKKACLKTEPDLATTSPACVYRTYLHALRGDQIHTTAAHYPDKPSEETQNHARALMASLAALYPCTYCRKDFKEEIRKQPPE